MKNRLPALVISCLVLWYAGNNLLWDTMDTSPVFNDQAHHLTNHALVLRQWRAMFMGEALPVQATDELYPPFYYLAAGVWSLIFGGSPAAVTRVNLLFFAVLLVSLFVMARKAYGTAAGIMACVLLSLYPYIYGATRVFILEIAVCALATLCVCLLFYSRGFRDLRYTLAAAAVCLAGMLTKQPFFLYILGPVVCTVVSAGKEGALVRRAVLFLLVGLMLPAVFYALFFSQGTAFLLQRHVLDAALFSPADPWKRNLYYLWVLADQVGWPNVLLFGASFAAYLRVKGEGKAFFLSWFLVSLAALQLAPLKVSRYSLPLLPAVALFSSWGICRLNRRFARIAVFGGVAVFGVVLHYSMLFHHMLPPAAQKLGRAFFFPRETYAEYAHLPMRGDLETSQQGMFRILADHAPAGRIARIGITDYSVAVDAVHPWAPREHRDAAHSFILCNEWGMRYECVQQGLPYKIYPLSFTRSDTGYDLLVTVCPLSDTIPVQAQEYALCGQVTVPSDKSTVYCYARINPAPVMPEGSSQWAQDPLGERGLMMAQQAFKRREYGDAINALARLLARKGLPVAARETAYVGMASCYVEKAVELRAGPRNTVSSLWEGHYLRQAEKYFKKAEGYAGAWGRLQPSICSGLGYVYMREKRFGLAIGYLARGLAACPAQGAEKEREDMEANMAECRGLVNPLK